MSKRDELRTIKRSFSGDRQTSPRHRSGDAEGTGAPLWDFVIQVQSAEEDIIAAEEAAERREKQKLGVKLLRIYFQKVFDAQERNFIRAVLITGKNQRIRDIQKNLGYKFHEGAAVRLLILGKWERTGEKVLAALRSFGFGSWRYLDFLPVLRKAEDIRKSSKRLYELHREERKKQKREHRAKHREEINTYQIEWYKAHREEYRTKMRACYAAHREERKAKVKEYRELNREKCRETVRKSCAKYREEYNAKKREYRVAHREEINAKNRQYRTANREKVKEKNRKYREKHREEINAKNRERRAANREKVNAKQREYRKNNPEKFQAYYKKKRTKSRRKSGKGETKQ